MYRQGKNQEAVAPVPLLIGSNQNEGTIFASFASEPGRDISALQYLGANYAFGGVSGVLKALVNYPTSRYPTRGLAAAAVSTDNLFACPTSDMARTRTAQTRRSTPTSSATRTCRTSVT